MPAELPPEDCMMSLTSEVRPAATGVLTHQTTDSRLLPQRAKLMAANHIRCLTEYPAASHMAIQGSEQGASNFNSPWSEAVAGTLT